MLPYSRSTDVVVLPSARPCHPTLPSLRSAFMPIASVNGIKLYYEVTGSGYPLLFSHEFAGDSRSWEPQVRYFSRRYRVVTYNHRGYSPSTVPRAARDYSQDLLVEDLHQLMTHLELAPVHLGGCSMGANVARDFAIAHPEMA